MEEGGSTIWCGNLAEQVTEEILYELFLQAGPLEKVRIGRDREGNPRNFAFITYCHEVSVPYAIELLRGTSLFNKALILTYRGRMPYLPPPIRCHGPEVINLQANELDQFANMTQNLNDDVMRSVLAPRMQMEMELLRTASLQGNWSHRHLPNNRHHPYMGKHSRSNERSDLRAHRANNFRSSHRPDPIQQDMGHWSRRKRH